MAQNDTHVALIILTTQMWGGWGIIGGKNFFGPNFVFLCLWRQHPFLHKTKGQTRNPISPTPPPSAGVHVTPPPPPQSNFQVAKGGWSPKGSRPVDRRLAANRWWVTDTVDGNRQRLAIPDNGRPVPSGTRASTTRPGRVCSFAENKDDRGRP